MISFLLVKFILLPETIIYYSMKKHTLLFVALCLVSLTATISSCEKSTPKSKTELISRTWKVQKAEEGNATVFEVGGVETVKYGLYSLSFNSSGFTLSDKSNTNSSGTWAFDSTQENINLSVPSNPNFQPASVRVITLSETQLTIRYTEVNNKGVSTEITLYLVPAG